MGSWELALLAPPALEPSVGMNISAGEENAPNDGAPEPTSEEALIALAFATTIWPWLEAAPSSCIDSEDVAAGAASRLGDLGKELGSMLSLGGCHNLLSCTCTRPTTSQPSPSSAPGIVEPRAASGNGTAAEAAAAARKTAKRCKRGSGRQRSGGMRL